MTVTVPPEPPVRLVENLDVSFQDLPYPVVPALTWRCIVHLAVECEAVYWGAFGESYRVDVRTKCGKTELHVDRRHFSWSRPCKRCFPDQHTEQEAGVR